MNLLLIIPLIPWIVAAVVVVVSTTVIIIHKKLKGNNMAVLGPKGSGKTTFINYLRGVNSNASTGTGMDSYETFTFELDNGKKIKIKNGKDIGGGADFKHLYEQMIKDSDAVIIIFDVNRYLFDTNKNEEDGRTYEELTKVRFKFVRDKINETHGKIDPERVAVIGSHIDETGKDNRTLREMFDKTIEKMPYRDVLANRHFCNLTNKEELRKVVNIIFGKKIFTK